ncbi:MAG: putative glyoxylase family protein, partial [Frankiales bacterium]|nr:putative glyoxylase family protein [Frankiales bacterium]
MTQADIQTAIVTTDGIDHVRLTVTDIARSRAFYIAVFGSQPVADFSDQVGLPSVREDPHKLFGGCMFAVGLQAVGLRPVARADDLFDSTRVGLDHLGLRVPAEADLHAAAERMSAAGIEHGQVQQLPSFGIVILSFQDPDGINLELTA